VLRFPGAGQGVQRNHLISSERRKMPVTSPYIESWPPLNTDKHRLIADILANIKTNAQHLLIGLPGLGGKVLWNQSISNVVTISLADSNPCVVTTWNRRMQGQWPRHPTYNQDITVPFPAISVITCKTFDKLFTYMTCAPEVTTTEQYSYICHLILEWDDGENIQRVNRQKDILVTIPVIHEDDLRSTSTVSLQSFYNNITHHL